MQRGDTGTSLRKGEGEGDAETESGLVGSYLRAPLTDLPVLFCSTAFIIISDKAYVLPHLALHVHTGSGLLKTVAPSACERF